ncbi:MAG: InlB B-repeat-containing protein [Christensenellales bacterium]|jgi:uncharacterized repeat protein (TIGR02543 family)
MKRKIAVFIAIVSFILIISATVGACGLIPSRPTASEYKITFASNGGTTCAPIIITPGSNSFTMPTPTRDGYTFAGWYVDNKKYTKSWSDYMTEKNNVISSNITLYAKWVEVTLVITLDANGGQYPGANVFDYSHGVDLQLPIPTRKGCAFIGWYDDIDRVVGDRIDKKRVDGEEITYYIPGDYEKQGTVTLYAQWDIKCGVLPIEDAGNITPSSNYYVLDDSTQDTITFTASAAPNFEFKEWQIVGNTTKTVVDNPMTHKYIADVEISAVFEGVETNATLNSNYPEGPSSDTYTSQTIRYASSLSIDPPAPYPGYQFIGWFSNKTGGDRISNRFGEIETYPFCIDMTIYAQWREGTIATDFEYEQVGTAPNAYYKITGYMGASRDLYIPFSLDGTPVKEIGGEFVAQAYAADKVIIPYTIETISPASFTGFTGNIYFDRGFSNLNIIDAPTFSESHNIYVHGMYIKEANIYSNGEYKNSFNLGVKSQYIDDVYYNFFGHYVDSSIDSREELQALVDYSYVFTAKNPFACKLTYLTGSTTLQAEIEAAMQAVSGYRNNTASEFLEFSSVTITSEGKNVIKVNEFAEKAESDRIASVSAPAPDTIKVKSMVTSYVVDDSVETGVFQIDYADPYIVYNSEQLLYAVENGYKPVFMKDSDPIVQAEINNARTIYEKARNTLLQIIPRDTHDFQKATIIHDWIIDHNSYDFNLLNLSKHMSSADLIKYKGFYLDGVFIDGYAVCDGISKAFSLMARIEGMETIRASGVVISNDENEENHAWNKIKIANKWHSLDVTADGLSILDESRTKRFQIKTHKYFLINDIDMGKKNRENAGTSDPFYVKRNSTGSYNYYTNTEYAEGKSLYVESNADAIALATAFEEFCNEGSAGNYYGLEYVYKNDYDITTVYGAFKLTNPGEYGDDKFQVLFKEK